MANPVEGTLVTAAVTVALAGAVGYGIYRLTNPKHKPASPLDLARKWFAWMAVLVSFATLPPFFRLFDVNSIAMWVIALVFYGGLAFGAGWLYGKFVKFSAAGVRGSSASSQVGPEHTKGTCPRCGGPVEGNVCWSCGARWN